MITNTLETLTVYSKQETIIIYKPGCQNVFSSLKQIVTENAGLSNTRVDQNNKIVLSQVVQSLP